MNSAILSPRTNGKHRPAAATRVVPLPSLALAELRGLIRRAHDDALDRVQAAHWLLDEMHLGGQLACLIDPQPAVLEDGSVGTWRPRKTEKAHAYWITRMALHEIGEALTELRLLTNASRRNESA